MLTGEYKIQNDKPKREYESTDTHEISKRTISVLGIRYTVSEVECVSKERLEKGEINYLTNGIRIDKNLSSDQKNQTLLHELLHAIFEALGMDTLSEDEQAVQAIASALYCLLTSQTIF